MIFFFFRFPKIFSDDVSKMLKSSINEKMQEREQSGIVRNDFIDVLITLKNEDKNKVGSENISSKYKKIYL